MRSTRLSLVLSFVVGLAALTWSGASSAEPTVWQKARDPSLAERHDALDDADGILSRFERLIYEQVPRASIEGLYLGEAKGVLERALRERPGDSVLAWRVGMLAGSLGRPEEAKRHLESVVAEAALPAYLLRRAWATLAIAHARLGEYAEEIHAYEEAIGREVHGSDRSIWLANQAEAFMVVGEADRAVAGYDAALAELTTGELPDAVTTMWGRAVALDRAGDLNGALDSIRLARAYDPIDQRLESDAWFYVPAYDEAWYAALGHLTAARDSSLSSSRAAHYERAVARWTEFIERAKPADGSKVDPWLPIAKARREATQREQEEFMQRYRDRLPQGGRR